MRRREKILLVAAVAVGLVYVGYAPTGGWFSAAFTTADREIRALEATRDRLRAQAQDQPMLLERWRDFGQRTLAADETEARRKLNLEIKRLIAESRVREVSVSTPQTTGRPGRLRQISVPLTVEGSPQDLVSLFQKFQQWPFMAQLRDPQIVPAGERKAGLLRLTVKIETVVLPEIKLWGEVVPWDPQALPERDPLAGKLLAFAEEDYRKIWEKNVFEPYKPPPASPPPVEEKLVERPTRNRREPTPPPPPPDTGTITGLLAYPGQCEMITRDRSRRRKIYTVGDEVAGGELVYVHPYGAVVRIADKDYLYPIGAALDDPTQRYEVDAVPEVREDLERLRAAQVQPVEAPEGAVQ